MSTFYFMAGVITFWVLRIGLLILLCMFIIGWAIDKQNYSCTVRVNERTWKKQPLPWKRYLLEEMSHSVIVFLIVFILDVVCWLTLFI